MYSSSALSSRFRHFFQTPRQVDPSRLRELYSEQILFRDPAREIRGLVELEDYYSRLRDDLGDGRFEYLDELASDNSIYLKWNLHFTHPRDGQRPISLRGVSHLQGKDRIEFHEEIYDPGLMRYDQLPRLGRFARWIGLRRAS